MRIALVDRPDEVHRFPGNRFSALATLLRERGHEVLLHQSQPPVGAGPDLVLTALNRAESSRPLVEAHLTAHQLASFRPDLVICPLSGGIGQGILMSRACGEGFADTRVALWCDTPSRAQFGRTEDSSALGTLIGDALERQAMALADALIIPGRGKPDGLDRLMIRPTTIVEAMLPSAPAGSNRPASRAIREIVFVGPVTRATGIPECIEAARRLARDGTLGDVTVVFLGAARNDVHGIGTEWLGLSAASWPFSFKVVDAATPDAILRYLADGSRLAVAVGDDEEELEPVRQHAANHCLTVRSSNGAGERLVERLESALRIALRDDAHEVRADHPPADWDALIRRIADQPLHHVAAEPASGGVSVCIVHHDRLDLLATAIASIPDRIGEKPIEIIVLDNASQAAFVEEEIRHRAGTARNVRIIRSATPLPQGRILNQGLAQARFDTVLFLDDDNSYLEGGVARLAAAVEAGNFDVVVTPLELFDADATRPSASPGRLIFLGAAHSAGLFFNGFGDTSFAVRRDAFMKLGGFHDPGYDYPCLDWVTLAKAQAAGLRIGTLQWPAVRYRRDIARANMAAHKLDQEGARALVFEVYGDAFDARLVARYAQVLQLAEL